jgi:hypothetical protein
MPVQPNIGDSLVRIHRAITRALDTVADRGAYFSQNGFPDAASRRGFMDYARCLCITLRAHHLAEDEVAFPYFRGKVPEAPYERLAQDHQTLERLIAEADAVIGGLGKDVGVSGLAALHGIVKSARDVWGPHIRIEEDMFSPVRLSSLMSPDEHRGLGRRIMEHNQRHSEPGYLVVPFILRNLGGGDRAKMSAEMPSIVTKLLVPVVWRGKWAPMRPFLLP